MKSVSKLELEQALDVLKGWSSPVKHRALITVREALATLTRQPMTDEQILVIGGNE